MSLIDEIRIAQRNAGEQAVIKHLESMGLAKKSVMGTVKINVKVVERTDLAILVSDGRKEAWVPLSQIEEVIEEPGLFGPVITAIIVPDWLAVDKGLQQLNRDEDTLDLFRGAA